MPKKLIFLLVAVLSAISAFSEPSGTLPVLYINTADNAPIVSKDDYLTASYYLDAMELDGYTAVGSADQPLTMQIRGRGNWTWVGFNKKPYRLKLDSKQSLLGLKKSKHFGLLANADDNLGFLRNAVGFEVSRHTGLAWTPSQRPVEVVLNGDYIGLYFLTELIRVDSDRVNVVEQADNETDKSNITGGWLVEIDNYDDPSQLKINENNGTGELMRFTYKTPEVLSAEQSDYLLDLVTAADAAIYNSDKESTQWQDYIDIDELAKFYIVQEVTDNCESFHGSCYWYKDRGADTKMFFGPVWDFGNSFQRGTTEKFVFQEPPFHQHWIGEIAKYPAFMDAVKFHWLNFKAKYPLVLDFIDGFIAEISSAAINDCQRWTDYGNGDISDDRRTYYNLLSKKINWLNKQWYGNDQVPVFGNLYITGASEALGSWQAENALKFAYDESTQTYSLHLSSIDRLNNGRGFKIIDRNTWSGAMEMCGNGSSLKLNEDYEVSNTIHDSNITLDVESVENVDLTVRCINNKWILRISDESGAVDPIVNSSDIAIAGKRGYIALSSAGPCTVEVFAIGGSKVASCTVEGEINLPLPPAIYIVKTGASCHKVTVR